MLTCSKEICYSKYIQKMDTRDEKGELVNMLEDEILIARDKLNESIITGKDYSEVYRLSVELDELIAKYYLRNEEND